MPQSDHAGRDGANEPDWPEHMHRETGLNVGYWHVEQGPIRQDAGIIDEHPDFGFLRFERLQRRLDAYGIGNVEGQGRNVEAGDSETRRLHLPCPGVARGEPNRKTFAGKALDNRQPNAAIGARDKDGRLLRHVRLSKC